VIKERVKHWEDTKNTSNHMLNEEDELERKKKTSFLDLLINDENDYTYDALKDEVKTFLSAVKNTNFTKSNT
jgi:hypothetical protein